MGGLDGSRDYSASVGWSIRKSMPPASSPAEPKRLRILMVEDSAADAELLLHELKRGNYEVVATRVETADAMRLACDWTTGKPLRRQSP